MSFMRRNRSNSNNYTYQQHKMHVPVFDADNHFNVRPGSVHLSIYTKTDTAMDIITHN